MPADDAARTAPHGPARTCIGCRRAGPRSALVRIVAIEVGGSLRLVADHARRSPGRGAWLHRDPECVALAVRRKAFGRALRAAGDLDTTVPADLLGPPGAAPPRTTSTNRERVDE